MKWQFVDIDFIRDISWLMENYEVDTSRRFRNLRNFYVIGFIDIFYDVI